MTQDTAIGGFAAMASAAAARRAHLARAEQETPAPNIIDLTGHIARVMAITEAEDVKALVRRAARKEARCERIAVEIAQTIHTELDRVACIARRETMLKALWPEALAAQGRLMAARASHHAAKANAALYAECPTLHTSKRAA